MRFRDKIVWITGASSGIGEALAYAFQREGARLILSSRHADALERVRSHCPGDHDDITVLPLDLADFDSLPEKAERALAAFGRIDILINNGGIGQHSLAAETSLAVDKALIFTNYLGQVALTKAVLPGMMRRQAGHIVVVSSVTGKMGVPNRSGYAASKHALHGYFDSLRAEIWRYGIKVSIVCPGRVRTEFRANALKADGSAYGHSRASAPNSMSAEVCAAKILDAVAKGKDETYIGRESLAIYAQRFFPGLVSRALRGFGNI
jgi:dehydrogenase/reductase SDR family member 7B